MSETHKALRRAGREPARTRPEVKLDFNTDWTYSPAPESTAPVTLDKRYGLFIDGKFVAPRSGRYFETTNPANESVQFTYPFDVGPDFGS